MSIRETIGRNKWASAAAAISMLLASAGLLAYTLWPEYQPTGDLACYTDDDGQTWFIDSTYKVVPFDHNGKQAVRAMVYSYDHGKKSFIVFLMRHNAKGQKQLSEIIRKTLADSRPLTSMRGVFDIDASTQEVKLGGPGHAWVPRTSAEGAKVMEIRSPDGSELDTVIP